MLNRIVGAGVQDVMNRQSPWYCVCERALVNVVASRTVFGFLRLQNKHISCVRPWKAVLKAQTPLSCWTAQACFKENRAIKNVKPQSRDAQSLNRHGRHPGSLAGPAVGPSNLQTE